MKHLVFLASGNGGNLKFFFLALRYSIVHNLRLTVIADRECGSIDFARINGLENYVIKYKRTENKELLILLGQLHPDIIVTNWHKIIDETTVTAFSGKLINLHYSLLPAFGGLIGIEPIERAYKQGCRYIGPTCHFVDEGVDTGKIIAQAIFTTDIPINEAVRCMFRKGCVVLLNGIQRVTGNRFIEGENLSGEDLSFSPAFGFNDQSFSEEFWKELASL